MIRQIIKIFKALNSNAEPWQLSLGVCFGAVLGLTPLFNLHNLLILFLAFIINLNIGITFLSFIFFSGMAYLLDPIFHYLGLSVLRAEALSGFWAQIFSCPFSLLANLNNSIVMGSLIVSVLLAFPLFFVFNVLIVKYREHIKAWFERFPIFKSLKIVKIYQTLTGD